jgi:hypothetical protein
MGSAATGPRTEPSAWPPKTPMSRLYRFTAERASGEEREAKAGQQEMTLMRPGLNVYPNPRSLVNPSHLPPIPTRGTYTFRQTKWMLLFRMINGRAPPAKDVIAALGRELDANPRQLKGATCLATCSWMVGLNRELGKQRSPAFVLRG